MLDPASHGVLRPVLLPFGKDRETSAMWRDGPSSSTIAMPRGTLTGFRRLATELVGRAPDVFWTVSDAAAWAAKRATTTIPIVVGVSDGLVDQGLVARWPAPGATSPGWNTWASR